MLLTIDVGNTQTVLGLYEDGASRSSAEARLGLFFKIEDA